MILDEAIRAAEEGNFVSNRSFDDKQSMHGYNGHLYYEDGANLTSTGFVNELKTYDWAKDGWYIKYPAEIVNKEKLERLHENSTYMLRNESYEDCINIRVMQEEDIPLSKIRDVLSNHETNHEIVLRKIERMYNNFIESEGIPPKVIYISSQLAEVSFFELKEDSMFKEVPLKIGKRYMIKNYITMVNYLDVSNEY